MYFITEKTGEDLGENITVTEYICRSNSLYTAVSILLAICIKSHDIILKSP